MSERLRIGVLLAGPVQLLDAAPVDLFGMLTKDYLRACQLPEFLVNLGLDIDIQYISELGKGATVDCTANAGLRVTSGIEDKGSSPGELDILMIPGPDPAFVPTQKVLQFVSDHSKHGATIMTVCTGIFVAAPSGVLDGKRVTAPRALLSQLKSKFPKADWQDKRWVTDGNIWTSGGVTNGLDLTAAYIRQRWPGPLSDIVLAMADVGDRPVDYDVGRTTETLWFVWKFLGALSSSLFTKKKSS